MIEVNNLTKIYGKGKTSVNALRGASFTLPDKGLVFIVGKSGSGKSTLLNILGGLDDATSGEIFVDGEDITKLHPRELDNYRNYFVGIVYQHFNLFEDETVMQNIRIATDISDKKLKDENIDVVVDRLDLTEKRDVLVRELSGGQKQRVAIARALAKYPHMILADEPTGNLDSKTSIAIHNYLQRISREKLVVVISHDMKNAHKYADRIIEISDGQVVHNIIRDNSKNQDNQISVNSDVSDEKLQEINDILKDKGISLTKQESGFVENKLVEKYEGEKISFKGKNKSWRNALKLSYKFWNSSKGSFFITAIISTLIISLLTLAHGFAVYDGAEAVQTATERYDATNFIMQKGYSITSSVKDVNQDYVLSIDKSEKEKIANNNELGKFHEIYPVTIFNGQEQTNKFKINKDVKDIYLEEGFGTMVVDKNYIEKVFHTTELLAGSYYDLENKPSVLITDYMADSIIAKNKLVRKDGLPIISLDPNDPYQGLLGSTICYDGKLYPFDIAGIIKTNYREKYNFIFRMLDEANREPQNAQTLLKRLFSSDIFLQFQNDIKTKYGFTYTLDQNFLEDYIDVGYLNFSWFKNCELLDEFDQSLMSFNNDKWFDISDELAEGEILIAQDVYDEMFGTADPLNKKLKFEMFDFNQNNTDVPKYKKTFTIKGTIAEKSNSRLRMNKVDFKKYAMSFFDSYALSFEDVSKAHTINSTLVPEYYYSNMQAFNSIFQLIDIVRIFSKFFLFIAVLLMALVVMVVVSHNLRIIKKNQYRLGVYKSLGYSAAALADSTILNSLIMVGTLLVLSTAFMVGLSNVMNILLTNSFVAFLKSDIFLSLKLVAFSFPTLAIYLGGTTCLILLSTFLPVIAIRKIKPNIIINKAD